MNVIYISAKCNDKLEVYGTYNAEHFGTEGYPPSVPGLMEGDYVDFGIDLDTGKIRNWDLIVRPAILRMISEIDND